jgi:hypothetical protein
MRSMLAWVLILVVSVSVRGQTLEGTREEREARKKEARGLKEKLKELVFPKVEFKEVRLSECVKWLKAQGVELEVSPDFNVEDAGIQLANGEVLRPLDTKITLTLKEVPALEVIKYVTNLANVKYELKGGKVVVAPLGTELGFEAFLQEWTVPPSFFGAPLEKNQAPFFEGKGVIFYEGNFAVYSAGTQQLIVKHGDRQIIELIDDWIAEFEKKRDEGK